MENNKRPEFIQRDPDVIVEEYLSLFKEILGKDIEPSQIERLILNAIAYREILLVNRFNAGMSQLLYQFSSGAMLDYIANLVAVERLTANKAGCTVRFNLVDGHGTVLIPEGTRVASSDGNAIFETTEDLTIPPGINQIEVYVLAQTAGKDSNGYTTGQVNKILDPYAFISAVKNIDTTGGGSDPETDEALRERIRMAPSQFSSAGSRSSYLFYAKSANSLVDDVSVSSPLPGVVLIVPLTENEELAQSVVEDIYTACSSEKVRPITDTVIVAAPKPVDFTIEVNIILYDGVDATTEKYNIEQALKAYAQSKREALGKDIILSHISQACRRDNVYDVEVISPSGNMEVEEDEYAHCEDIVVNITGFNYG